MCKDDLCKDNLVSEYPLEFISEEYLKVFHNKVRSLEVFGLRTFFKEDIKYTIGVDGKNVSINLCTVLPDFDDISFVDRRAFRDALAFKIRRRYNKKKRDEVIDDFDERRNVYFFIKTFFPDFKLLFRPDENISGINYPDFILDMTIGIEVTEYRRDKLVNRFDKYVKLKKTQFIDCDDLASEFKSFEDFKKLINRLNPTIKDGYILAYSDPNYTVHTISNDVDVLLNKILNSKLKKYNRGHYRVFETNILLVYSPISIMKNQFEEFCTKLTEKWPRILETYNLKICIFDGIYFKMIDLEQKTIMEIDVYS